MTRGWELRTIESAEKKTRIPSCLRLAMFPSPLLVSSPSYFAEVLESGALRYSLETFNDSNACLKRELSVETRNGIIYVVCLTILYVSFAFEEFNTFGS